MMRKILVMSFLLSVATILVRAQDYPYSNNPQYDQNIPGNMAIPVAMRPIIMEYYPLDCRTWVSKGDPTCDPQIPLDDDLTNGAIQCWGHSLSPSGPEIYIVTYSRCPGLTTFRVFKNEGPGSYSYLWGANPSVDGITTWDPKFEDLDKDGRDEIVLYWYSRQRYLSIHGVLVLAFRNGAIVPITPYDPATGSIFRGPEKPDGSQEDSTYSNSGVGFLDIEGDGTPELLLYPFMDRNDETRREFATGGTRVYKLVNGIYTFQYETAVGEAGMPPMGAAIKPASVPLSELEAAGGGQGGGGDQALSLYLMAPASYTIADVDWASLRAGDFAIAPTADRGTQPAPFAPDQETGWMPWQSAGQPVFLEEIPHAQQGQFQQQPSEPRIYFSFSGRLHLATPYREVQFSKKAAFAWLWRRWQKGGGLQEKKNCVAEGNHQRCHTPIVLPLRGCQ